MAENHMFHQARTNVDWDWVIALDQVCSFNQAQYETLILDGYNNSDSVINQEFYNDRNWANNKAKLTAAQGGCSYGYIRITPSQGLFYWILDMKMCVNPVVLTYFDQQERDLAMDMSFIHNREREKSQANENTANFEVNEWID